MVMIYPSSGGGLSETQVVDRMAKDGLAGAILPDASDFQVNPATGDFDSRGDQLNDGSTVSGAAEANTIDQYAEVDFGIPVIIKRWRQYGDVANNGDGVWKIQYYDFLTTSWTDWVTGIATRATADWTSLVAETERLTTKIRLICTAVDTSTASQMEELEVIY